MARYLATIEGTTEAFQGFIQNPEDRKTANQPLFTSLGFEIEHYWFGVGETNLYLVFTNNDNTPIISQQLFHIFKESYRFIKMMKCL